MGILTDKTCSWFWDKLNPCVRRTGAIPTTLNHMRAEILYEWSNFPQSYVQPYVTSTRRRCLAIVNSAGGGGGGIPDTKFTWTWTPLRKLTKEYCDIYFVL